jgi:hypothetical protein
VSCALFGVSFSSTVVPFLLTSVVLFSRLPVRTLLFLCAVCDHGGHQTCYREYYTRQPMVDVPSALSTRNILNNEDDSASMISSQSYLFDPFAFESPLQTHRNRKSPRIAGHPCAAGCGHLCWAANRDSDDL